MTAAVINRQLRPFRLAHPVVRRSSRVQVTTFAALSVMVVAVWLVVLPLELALGIAP
jgi:hypothetical protein